MHCFRWHSESAIPRRYDLRRCGWQLVHESADNSCKLAVPLLVDARSGFALDRLPDSDVWPQARLCLMLGVDDPRERARLLAFGFGDVLGREARLPEIAVRFARIAEHADVLPRLRKHGPLHLDLIARDGFAGGRPLGLHPREFELIWRLAETPGLAVGKAELVGDVWRMAHVPDTNSVAVHIFRLRAKLAAAGLAGIVQTATSGGYVLALPESVALAAA